MELNQNIRIAASPLGFATVIAVIRDREGAGVLKSDDADGWRAPYPTNDEFIISPILYYI